MSHVHAHCESPYFTWVPWHTVFLRLWIMYPKKGHLLMLLSRLAKDFFWGIMKVPYTKNIHNLFQGPPNPGFRSVKVQTETFLKKDSQDFKNSFYLGFLWIPSKPGKQNWKLPFFWGVHNCKKNSVDSFKLSLNRINLIKPCTNSNSHNSNKRGKSNPVQLQLW